jgi:hypothetical protein
MTIAITIIVTLIILVMYLIYKNYTKDLVEYKTELYVVSIEHIKDIPIWLKPYDEIDIKETRKITHGKTLNVVMIATDEPTNIVLNTINNKLLLDNDKSLVERILPIHGKNQHLYFTSDNKIKKNDWILCYGADGDNLPIVIKYTGVELGTAKIEATTNTTITSDFSTPGTTFTPSISQSFIESDIKAYNEGNSILTVDVEIEEIFDFNIGDKLQIKNDVYGYKKGDYITVKNFNHKNENQLISYIKDDESQMGFNLGNLLYTTTSRIKTNSSNEVIIIEPEIPIYEIWQNNNKVGVFYTQQLAEK